MERVIILRQVSKNDKLPGGITLDLLNDVNIAFEKGKFAALTGISGTGKSTLLRIIIGHEEDFEGSVTILDRNIEEMDKEELEIFRNKNIGICIAGIAPVNPYLTVRENIINRMKVLYDEAIEEKVREIITLFELTPIADQEVSSGSPVDLYRLMLAQAFCGYPQIIAIDEVLDYFEGEERGKLFETISNLQKKHDITMIIITQEIEIINRADRAINIMNHTTYEVDLERLRAITGYS